jgi:hypothetical protein
MFMNDAGCRVTVKAACHLALALLLGGCATQREAALPVLEVGAIDLRLADEAASAEDVPDDEVAGHWQLVAAAAPPPAEARPSVPPRSPRSRRVAAAPPPRRPALAVPQPRAARPARPVGVERTRSAAQLAREHFLDYPTRIRASRISFHCPAALIDGVRLEGEQVDRSRPEHQRAVGRARLTLRELTLEADRITLRTRPSGDPDLQILARGDVRFVSDVRGNVHREEGLRSLIVTNDRTLPLR